MSGVGISGQVSYIYNQSSGLGWLCCFVPPLWLKPLFDCPEIQLCNSHRRKFSALIILPVIINLAQSINTCYMMVLPAQGSPDSTTNNQGLGKSALVRSHCESHIMNFMHNFTFLGNEVSMAQCYSCCLPCMRSRVRFLV